MKRNHKTIKKKHHFYAVGSGKMKTDRHTTRSQKPYKIYKKQNPCMYGSECYRVDPDHMKSFSHPSNSIPPLPSDIIEKWILVGREREMEKRKTGKDVKLATDFFFNENLQNFIFGKHNDKNEATFKKFIRYIVIHIKDYPNPVDKESIKLLLHRLQEDAIDYPMKVNNDEDKEFYKALTEMGFDEKDDDSNVIEFHGFELMFKI